MEGNGLMRQFDLVLKKAMPYFAYNKKLKYLNFRRFCLVKVPPLLLPPLCHSVVKDVNINVLKTCIVVHLHIYTELRPLANRWLVSKPLSMYLAAYSPRVGFY